MVKSRNTHVVEPIRDKNDIWRIIQKWNNSEKRTYAVLFELGVFTGLRISDLLKFKVKDVKNQSQVYLREKKTNKFKTFPLQKSLQNLLNDFCKGRKQDEGLFLNDNKRPITRIAFYKAFVKVCKKLDIKANIGTHTCRKTFAYHHYRQFNNIVLLQTILNHYSPDVTLRYIGITQDEINNSYLNLNLDPPQDEIKQAKLTSRIKSRRIESFCHNYLKNGGKKHKEFALIILDILCYNTLKERK